MKFLTRPTGIFFRSMSTLANNRTKPNVLVFSSLDKIFEHVQSAFLSKLGSENLPQLDYLHPTQHGLQATELRSRLQKAEIILSEPQPLATHLESLFDGEVKWIQCSFAGFNVLADAWKKSSKKRVIPLSRSAGIFGKSMSEYVLAYVLARERHLFEYQQQQSKSQWLSYPYRTLNELSIGIMGTGDIGGYIGNVFKSFGSKIIGLNRSGKSLPQFDELYTLKDLPTFLSHCDYIVSVLPHTSETQNLLSGYVLANCKPSCTLINIGRGTLIDEQSIIRAIENKWIDSFVLDVFETEPLLKTSPLWKMEKVVITPHISGISFSSDVSRIFAENYLRYISNESPQYLVDWDRGY